MRHAACVMRYALCVMRFALRVMRASRCVASRLVYAKSADLDFMRAFIASIPMVTRCPTCLHSPLLLLLMHAASQHR